MKVCLVVAVISEDQSCIGYLVFCVALDGKFEEVLVKQEVMNDVTLK